MTSQRMPELSPNGFEILCTAVGKARDRQIKSVKALREHLRLLFPSHSDEIEEAIAYWAASVRRNGINE